MADYIVPVNKFEKNLIHAADGSVWTYYTLTGAIYNAYESDSVGAAQVSQQRLFEDLAGCPSNDILILGIKAQTAPEDIIRACTAGLPDFSETRYREFYKQMSSFYQSYRTGQRREFTREYILAAKIKSEQGSLDKALGREIAEGDTPSLADAEAAMYKSIPAEYNPQRCDPYHARWIHERFTHRGLHVPSKPKPTNEPVSFGPRSFSPYIFDKNAQVDAFADQFQERFERGESAAARNFFLAKWRTARESTMCAVINPDERDPERPEGAVSYQMLAAVMSYPRAESGALNSFTYIVDQQIHLDADFAQRITFDWSAVTKDGARTARTRLSVEADYNATDDFDMEDYEETHDEQTLFRQQVKAERASVAIKVATIFAFSHPNWEHLIKQVASVQQLFSNNGFELKTIPGGGEELWRLMAPGQPLTALGRDLQQTSTIRRFAASLPVRSIQIGSPTGFPIAISKENALGQIVRMDLMRATDAGSGSIASSGEPRGGKSYLNKKLGYAYLDMGAHEHVIDMSTHGEYAVFANALPQGESTVVQIARGSHSMDPLRVYEDDPATANDIFITLWLPMLEMDAKSEAGTALLNLLDSRAGGIIRSTRDLFEYVRRNGPNRPAGDPLKILYGAFLPYANATYSRMLIDPFDSRTGRVIELPLLERDAKQRLIVFRTNNLTPPRKDKTAQQQPQELFTSAAYMAIARYTQERFSRINDVCVTIADEVAFLGESRVPEILIKTPDKMGAKEKNSIIASTQLVADLDENYALIPFRFAFRQRNHTNAQEALTWTNVPVTPSTLSTITTGMSPLDVTGQKVMPGREGECYMNVGGIAFVQILPMPSYRAMMSDTTASKMIREDELV